MDFVSMIENDIRKNNGVVYEFVNAEIEKRNADNVVVTLDVFVRSVK